MVTAVMQQGDPGDVSVGTDGGSRGTGTARDRGTGAPGSNLTADDTTPAPGMGGPSETGGDAQQGADEDAERSGLLEGTRTGPAQPSA